MKASGLLYTCNSGFGGMYVSAYSLSSYLTANWAVFGESDKNEGPSSWMSLLACAAPKAEIVRLVGISGLLSAIKSVSKMTLPCRVGKPWREMEEASSGQTSSFFKFAVENCFKILKVKFSQKHYQQFYYFFSICWPYCCEQNMKKKFENLTRILREEGSKKNIKI